MKAVFAILLGLTGLLMSSCGLIFTVLGGNNTSVVIIAIPSLIVGGLLAWWGTRLWKSREPGKPVPPAQ